jgi:hypothetical protein
MEWGQKRNTPPLILVADSIDRDSDGSSEAYVSSVPVTTGAAGGLWGKILQGSCGALRPWHGGGGESAAPRDTGHQIVGAEGLAPVPNRSQLLPPWTVHDELATPCLRGPPHKGLRRAS